MVCFCGFTTETPIIDCPIFRGQAITSLQDDDNLPAEWRTLSGWLQDRSHHRKSFFSGTFSVRQIAERERDYQDIGTIESLTSAIEIDPTLPLARLLLASSLERETQDDDVCLPARVAFLRRYDLDLLAAQRDTIQTEELAVLYTRAAQSLNEAPLKTTVGIGSRATNIHEEALAAAEQALTLNPKLQEAARQKAAALESLNR